MVDSLALQNRADVEAERKRRLEKERTVQVPEGGRPLNSTRAEDEEVKQESPEYLNSRNDKVAQRVSDRVKRHAAEESSSKVFGEAAGYGTQILSKYGWRQLDIFLLGFASITTVSFIAVALAFVALVFLDIRWIAGHLSSRIPPMLTPQAIWLAFLNAIVGIVFVASIIFLIVIYCFLQSPTTTIVKGLANYLVGTNFVVLQCIGQ